MLLIVFFFSEEYDLNLVWTMSSLKDSSPFNVIQSQLLILATPGQLISILCKRHTFHASEPCYRVSLCHIIRMVSELASLATREPSELR